MYKVFADSIKSKVAILCKIFDIIILKDSKYNKYFITEGRQKIIASNPL